MTFANEKMAEKNLKSLQNHAVGDKKLYLDFCGSKAKQQNTIKEGKCRLASQILIITLLLLEIP